MEVAVLMASTSESSLFRRMLSADEHRDEVSVTAVSSGSSGSQNVPFDVELNSSTARLLREAFRTSP